MRISLLLLTAALLGMQLSGCTAIGIGVGAAVDHHHAKPQYATWETAHTIPCGRAVQVTLTSGDTLYGRFTGLRALPPDSYRCAYDSARILLAGESVLPQLGDTVMVVRESGWRHRSLFHGLGPMALDMRLLCDTSACFVPLRAVARLQDIQGTPYDLTRLSTLMSARLLPTEQQFVVQSDMQTVGIPLEHIQEIYAPPHHTYYWALGGVIGLAVDAAVVAAAVHAWNYQGMNIGPFY
jgi:hypothetical protein